MCHLTQGLVLAPITSSVEAALSESAFPGIDPKPPLADDMVAGIASLAQPNSAINRALRKFGVQAAEWQDEFDTVGLGAYRSENAWEKAHASSKLNDL